MQLPVNICVDLDVSNMKTKSIIVQGKAKNQARSDSWLNLKPTTTNLTLSALLPALGEGKSGMKSSFA